MKVQGGVALVTGANRGIGKAIAEELLARVASRVYAGVRDPGSMANSRLVPVQLDGTDAARVAEVASELSDAQIVVNNAGIVHAATPLQEQSSMTPARTRGQLPRRHLGRRCP